MRCDDLVGYQWKVDYWCENCIRQVLGVVDKRISIEDILDLLAKKEGIYRTAKESYDSESKFPKVLFRDQCDDLVTCGMCGTVLNKECAVF
jgi:hypothetical protein